MDALNFPRNAVISGYDASKAAYGLAGYLPGSPQRGSSREARTADRGLTRGALGELVVHGDPKAAAKAFKEHPLYSALEVAGAGQVLGLAGAGARRAAGAALKRAGTARAPLRYGPARDQVQHRSYSANLAVQEMQRAAERSQRRRGLDPNRAHGKGRFGKQTFHAQSAGGRVRGAGGGDAAPWPGGDESRGGADAADGRGIRGRGAGVSRRRWTVRSSGRRMRRRCRAG
jgi:hypothetical protein